MNIKSGGIINQILDLIDNNKKLVEINQDFRIRTGILNFFKSRADIMEFRNFLNSFKKIYDKKSDMGDFQTPMELTDKICEYISKTGFKPSILLEPTCGSGNFIFSALKYFPTLKYIYCVELQKEYDWIFKVNLLLKSFSTKINVEIEFYKDNIFSHNFSDKFFKFLNSPFNKLLILGNPPWITNTRLSKLNSNNIPIKSNIKGHRGIEAITGKGNFDIAEYIIISLLDQFSIYSGKIAILCKTSVVKNLIKNINILDLKISNIKSLLIDTKKEFNIKADASLFIADLGSEKEKTCKLLSFYNPDHIYSVFGWADDKFVSNMQLYIKFKYIDGKSQMTWRQGVKHDASKIMVLKKLETDLYINGLNETIQLEEDRLYPFLKSSDLKNRVIKNSDKKIIVTQTTLNDDTTLLANKYPKLWAYLNSHFKYLDNRKSVVYKNRPRFSIFGIGDYAFKPFKVAISGFYKEPNFSLIFPHENKPVMLDDTCYYLSFNNLENAFFTWLLLSLDEIKMFLKSIAFLDSKRPYTKDKLMRISLNNIIDNISFDTLFDHYKKNCEQFIFYDFNENDFNKFIKWKKSPTKNEVSNNN